MPESWLSKLAGYSGPSGLNQAMSGKRVPSETAYKSMMSLRRGLKSHIHRQNLANSQKKAAVSPSESESKQ